MKVSSLLKFLLCTFSQIKGNPSNNSIRDLRNENNVKAKFNDVLQSINMLL
jgi:hypothetical protein